MNSGVAAFNNFLSVRVENTESQQIRIIAPFRKTKFLTISA